MIYLFFIVVLLQLYEVPPFVASPFVYLTPIDVFSEL